MTASTFLQFLWPGVLVLLLLNVAIGYARARALVTSGRVTEEERRDFARAAAGWSIGYCLAQEAIHRASHTSDPTCLLVFPPHTGYGVATWVVAGGTVAFLLIRLWQDAPADLLTRIGPAFVQAGFLSGIRLTTRQVQFLITAILILALIANVVGSSEATSRCAFPSAAA